MTAEHKINVHEPDSSDNNLKLEKLNMLLELTLTYWGVCRVRVCV